MRRTFQLGTFDIPSVGKYSRIATYGTKDKDGALDFTVETLGQMVDNWAKRAMKLPLCLDHESAQPGRAPAAAFFDALALFDEGELLKFVAVGDDLSPPDSTDDKGETRNGLYARLSEITPLGEDPTEGLANYRYLSPFFTDQGQAEDGSPIGFELFDVAAVNIPFQAGCAIEFNRATEPRKRRVFGMEDKDLMAKLGLGEEASPEEMKGALKKYMADCEKKMAEDAEALKKFAEEKAKEEEEERDGESKDFAEDKEEAEKMAKSLGLEPGASMKAMRVAMSALFVPMAEFAAVKEQLDKLRTEQVEASAKQAQIELDAFVDLAVKDGRWPEEKKAELIEFAKASRQGAEKALFKKGTFSLMKNFSRELASRPTKTETVNDGANRLGAEFSAKARAFAKEKNVSLADAQRAIAAAHPDLYAAYRSGQ